jgi:hypothetical protein
MGTWLNVSLVEMLGPHAPMQVAGFVLYAEAPIDPAGSD